MSMAWHTTNPKTCYYKKPPKDKLLLGYGCGTDGYDEDYYLCQWEHSQKRLMPIGDFEGCESVIITHWAYLLNPPSRESIEQSIAEIERS